jgi:hypothetical protein
MAADDKNIRVAIRLGKLERHDTPSNLVAVVLQPL